MSHGNHWEAIHPTEQESLKELELLLKRGVPYEADVEPLHPGDYIHLLSPERPLSAVAIIRGEHTAHTMVSAYPTPHDLADNELEIYSIDSVTDGNLCDIEGVVRAITRDGAEVSFFCPSFLFFKERLESNRRFRFGLGAIAYSIEQAPKEILLTEGAFFEEEKKRRSEEDPNFDPSSFKSVALGMESFRAFFERDDGNLEFQSIVEGVTPFESLGTSGVILLVNLASEEREPIYVKLYASAKTLAEYSPQVGDSIRGVAWLQGVPQQVVEAEDSWMDSEEAAHGEGQYDDMMTLVSFMWSNPQLPVALQAIGGALIAAGWELQYIDPTLFRNDLPYFYVERDNKRYLIFIRTTIADFCEAEPYNDEEKSRWITKACEGDAKCLFITVRLESLGRNFSISAEGLGELSEELKLPCEACRPEEFKVVKVGQPEEEPEAVFDESAAIETYARCLNTADLTDFSKLLVEDLDFVSETANKSIKGRQQILSHIGSLLNAWKNGSVEISASVSKVEHEGKDRPCAIIFQGKVPFACTILTGRKAHVAGIQNLPQEVVDLFQNFDQIE